MDLDKMEQEVEELHGKAYGSGEDPKDTESDEVLDEEFTVDDLSDSDAAPKAEDFEQKYKTLQGKYTSELERMNSLLSTVLAEREQMAVQLERASKPTGQSTGDMDIDSDARFLDELVSEYPTIAKGVEALLERKLAEKMAVTEGKVDGLARRTDEVVAERYIKTLDELMPSWRQIKDKPEFVDWLNKPERYTGKSRWQLLIEADRSRNAQSVAAFYEDFAREAGVDTNRTSAFPASKPNQNISPSTSGNQYQFPTSKSYITRAEISQFYRDRALGKFTGTEEEAAKIEGRIMKAVRENKVR